MVTNIFLVCAFLSALVAAVPAPDLSPDENQNPVEKEQSLHTDFGNFNLEDFDIENIKKKLGLKGRSSKENDDTPIIYHDDDLIASLPEHFDARERWSQCPSLKEIRNQGHCGCCWAIAGVEAMTDRLCIHSDGTQNFHFSTEDVTSCAGVDGCNGGYLQTPWEYWKEKGIVSGGEYKSNEGCYPFEIDPNVKKVNTPPCKHSCRQGYNVTYEKDKRYGLSVYKIRGEEDMMAEIYKNGPIEAGMIVYLSFLTYDPKEIYTEGPDLFLGGHAVKIIGWGVENKVKYWLVANSWGTQWGVNGYFRILRGRNHCGIEGATYTSLPSLK